MKITIAIDSFKGSMTSLEAGTAAAEGIRRVYPDAQIFVRPLADGGEGTVEALTAGCGGTFQTVTVTGPLGKKVSCTYGIIKETKTAIIEMAGAAGITLIDSHERNPLYTTTYGVGEVIRDAITKGCRNFIAGIGGSATNDGGIGMLQALGFGMLKKDGTPVSFGAKGVSELHSITDADVLPELKECTFRIACDVSNPLCGAFGCSAVFAPQKGGTPEMIAEMDLWLARYAALAKEKYPDSDDTLPGSGAAGGLGFAFRTFLGGNLESGIKIVLEETSLRHYIEASDIVLTGEGRLDSQTVMGKAPAGAAEIAGEYHKPVLAFSGSAAKDAYVCNQSGIHAFFPIIREVCTLDEAMDTENAKGNMADTVEQVFRTIRIFYDFNFNNVFSQLL